MNEIAKALEVVYEPPAPPPGAAALDQVGTSPTSASAGSLPALRPFAKVNGVAPGSPAADAVRLTFHWVPGG